MRQNVVVSEFQREENAQEAFRRIKNASSTNGYEVYQAAVVTNDGTTPKIQQKIITGVLTRSHITSDCALGAILGLLFGLQGCLIGAFLGFLTGTVYDTLELNHDQKLLTTACATVQKDLPALIVIANEKYEDALDRKLIACNATIHRAYSQDLKGEHRIKHLAGI